MQPPPTERNLHEAQLLASRPDVVEQHIEVLRSLRDTGKFRRTLDRLLETAA